VTAQRIEKYRETLSTRPELPLVQQLANIGHTLELSSRDHGVCNQGVRACSREIRILRHHFGFFHGLVVLPDLCSDDNVLPQSLLTSVEYPGIFVVVQCVLQPVDLDLVVQGPGV
jgi:hypothetical protein